MGVNSWHQLALDEINLLGGTIDKTRHGKHLVVFWRIGERKLTTALPLSPSDHRALKNKISEIRRQARSLNMEAPRVAR